MSPGAVVHAETQRRSAWVPGKYAAIARASVMTSTSYMVDFLMRGLLMVIFLFTFAQIWTKTLPGTRAVAGLDASQLVWYMALTETVMLSLPKLEGTVVADVKTGGIAYLIARPMNYVLYQYANFAGEAALHTVVNGVIGAATAWALVGPLHVTLVSVVAWIACIAAGASLSFFMSTCIGLAAFWVEDVVPFFWIYNKMLFTLGGLFAPTAIYPGVFRTLAKVSPFNYVFAAPARLLVSFSWGALGACLASQAAWLTAAALLAGVIFRKGVRKVNVNGG